MSSQTNILTSSKWSGLGELGAKLITPVTTMVLARLLTPSAFGVVAVCNMLISFADIIVDSGFGKYLVRGDFKSNDELSKYADVAFWVQSCIGVVIWLIILIFRYPIATSLGSVSYALVIVISSLQIILVSLISTPTGLLRRHFKFKQLFKIRLLTAAVPLLVSVPLAYYTRSYWALVTGTLMANVANLLALNRACGWRPHLFFSFDHLKRMWKYCFWSLMEGLAHWCTLWIDIFIISRVYDAYYIGLYKNSTQILVSLIGTVTAAMSPVLLASLARTGSVPQCNKILYAIERAFMFVLLPIGIIIFFYRHLITDVILGPQWMDGNLIIGLWGVMLTISVFVYSFPAEAYKAKGKPKYLFCFQLSYLCIFVPICWWCARINFWTFIYARFYCVGAQVLLFIIFSKLFLKWEFKAFLSSICRPLVLSIGFVGYCCIINYWLIPNPNLTMMIGSLGLGILGYIVLLYTSWPHIKSTLISLKNSKITV